MSVRLILPHHMRLNTSIFIFWIHKLCALIPSWRCFHLILENKLSWLVIAFSMCSSRKYPYSPHRREWNFLGGGGGSLRPKNLKKCTKLNLNFQRGGGGGGGLRKIPFHGGGMDMFWNYTILNSWRKYQCLGMTSLYMFWCGISISLWMSEWDCQNFEES